MTIDSTISKFFSNNVVEELSKSFNEETINKVDLSYNLEKSIRSSNERKKIHNIEDR